MPTFAYKGRNGDGLLVEGVLDGADAGAVADVLREQRLTPVHIHAAQSIAGKGPAGSSNPLFKAKISSIDLQLFSRQMHTLLKAGVPMVRALRGLQDASATPAMGAVLGDVRERLEGGRDLSQALATHPGVFSLFYLAMVRVGEATGQLEQVFYRLYEHLDFERYMREQVKSALRYPSFVVIAMAIAMVVVNVFVIPTFAKVFAGMGAQLPLMTRVLLGFSNFTVAWWPLLLMLVIGSVVVFRVWLKTRAGRLAWDRVSLKLPIAGKVLRKAALSRFARSFSLAIKSGVPITQALSNSAQTVDNSAMAESLEAMRQNVERGESLLNAAVNSAIFSAVELQMIAVGEESGALDDMMDEIGDMYRQQVEYELKTLSQQIEPILIVMLGVMVLILALGIFLPMWDLGRAAIKR